MSGWTNDCGTDNHAECDDTDCACPCHAPTCPGCGNPKTWEHDALSYDCQPDREATA